MSLTLPQGARDAADIPTAVTVMADRAGHRPAMTLLAPTGRQEQSFASVAQWAAKTAHWLTLDLLLEPGDRLGVVGPPGWVPAVAALGAWWAGLTVVGEEAAAADIFVAHADHAAGLTGDVATWGWAFDGTADPPDDANDFFAHLVQPFPDTPPPPRGTATSPALGTTTQSDLLAPLRTTPATPLGITPDATPSEWLPLTALRPLLTSRPTVLLAPTVPAEAAAADRITTWFPGPTALPGQGGR